MGCPNISYTEMCYEADRLIRKKKKIDKEVSIEDIEKRLADAKHDNMFYFNCGIAASNVLHKIIKNDGCDDLNATVGGLHLFRDFIGLCQLDSQK